MADGEAVAAGDRASAAGASRAASSGEAPAEMSGWMIAMFAVAGGLAVGNLYYAQPLLDTLGREFYVGEATAGLIVTITQLGYAAGLVLIAPLGDLLENRRLIVIAMSATVAALIAAACARSFGAFLAASLAIGVTSVVAQILVPFAAHLAPPERRGRIVGAVMSGVLMGILLARAASGIISGAIGWRAVYVISAGLLMLAAFVCCARCRGVSRISRSATRRCSDRWVRSSQANRFCAGARPISRRCSAPSAHSGPA